MIRRSCFAFVAASLAAVFAVPALAGNNLQHAHSAESDLNDIREMTGALRRIAGEPVGWRSEEGRGDPTVTIKILGFNDFHGQLSAGRRVANRPVGGAAVLASYLRQASLQQPRGTLIIHAGDHVGASPPASALLQDEPSIQFLNQLANDDCRYADKRERLPWSAQVRYQPHCNVVGTLGNHEFDEGVTEVLRLVQGGNSPKGPFLENPYRGARFPYICANVVDRKTGEPILPPYTIRIVNGVQVGVIGAVLKETPTIVTPSGVAGVDFLDEAQSINRYVAVLKKAGIRTIIVTIHQGIGQSPSYVGPTNASISGLTGPIVDIVRNLDSEVDLVVSGHIHGFTNALIPNAAGQPILVTQAFSASTAYGDIDLKVSLRTGDVIEKTASIVTTWADQGPGLTPDADAAALTLLAEQTVAPLVSRVVGNATTALTRTESPSGESTLGNFIADAQRVRTGAKFAFMNPGGIRADLDVGPITWGELFTIQPFNNDLVSLDLTGAQIRTLLQQQWAGQSFPRILKTSGIWYSWTPCASYNPNVAPFCPQGGSPQVQDIRIGNSSGALIDPAATYRVTVNSFLASGGDNFVVLKSGTNAVVGPVDLDALVDYVEKDRQGQVSATLEGRIVRN